MTDMKVKDYKNCCRQLSQLSRAVVSFDICCKLLPALAVVKAVVSFDSWFKMSLALHPHGD